MVKKNCYLIGIGIHAVMNLEKYFDQMSHIDYCAITKLKYEKVLDKKGKPKLKSKLVTRNYIDHLTQPKL